MKSIEERILDLQNNRPVEKVTVFVYSSGECVWQGTDANSIPRKYKNLPSEIVTDDGAFYKDLDNYYKELNSLYEEAYDNFAEFMGWEDVDERIVNWIRYKCYERHHSVGYQEVMNAANDYEELITIIRNLKWN